MHMASIDRCFNVHDFRKVAGRRLPKGLFEYLDLGTEEGVALRENRAAFDRLRLQTRFLVDLGEVDFSTELFGHRYDLPIGLAPAGIAGLLWHQGELQLARAAAARGIPYALANTSISPMELVATGGGDLWFQVYVWEQVEESYLQIERARDLGYRVLVVTIDSALGRVREHNERNGFAFPFKPNARALFDMLAHPRWLTGTLLRTVATTGPPRNANYPERYQRMIAWRGAEKPRRHVRMTWKDLERIREIWPGPIVVKSVLSPDDARQAVDHGADGIVVSNHGGRAMDSAVAPIDALPGIVRAVGDRTSVILDSGVRRGSDVIKAIGLGAKFVLLGRAPLYGLAAGGYDGVTKMLDIVSSEFETTMGYLGRRTVAEIDDSIFFRPDAR
jgi:(S)-mandelate dehydrogenase